MSAKTVQLPAWIVVYYDKATDQIGIETTRAARRRTAARRFEDGGDDRIHVTAYTPEEWAGRVGHLPGPIPPAAPPAPMRVRFVYDPEPSLENPSGSPLPGPEAEYTGNEIHALIDPASDPVTGARRVVPYAEYCQYWGNPERHTVIVCLVEVQCLPCGAWKECGSLWGIDFMDDSPEIRGLKISEWRHGSARDYYTADEAKALPGYVGEVAGEVMAEAART